jgi:hypothetical protein
VNSTTSHTFGASTATTIAAKSGGGFALTGTPWPAPVQLRPLIRTQIRQRLPAVPGGPRTVGCAIAPGGGAVAPNNGMHRSTLCAAADVRRWGSGLRIDDDGRQVGSRRRCGLRALPTCKRWSERAPAQRVEGASARDRRGGLRCVTFHVERMHSGMPAAEVARREPSCVAGAESTPRV